jgi:hypothetical protein
MISKLYIARDDSTLTRFGLPIAAVLLIAIPTFLSRVVFLRILPVDVVARLVLFFAAVPLCGFIGNLGQSGVVSRRYSRLSKGSADWRADLISGGALVSVPTLLIVVGVSAYNRLDLFSTVMLAVSAICFDVTQQMSMMLLATESYTTGSVLDRLSGTILIVPALLVWLVPASRSVAFVVCAYTVLNGLIVILGLYLLKQKLPAGTRRLTLQDRKLGAAFWISSGVTFVRENLLIVVVQPAVSPLALAAFDAVSIFFRAFEIIRQPLTSIMLVDLTRSPKPAYLRRTLSVGFFGAIASLAAFLVIPHLLNMLYSGRYDQAIWMIPWLAVYHVVGWLNSVPAGYLFGRSNERVLTRFIRWKVISALSILLAGCLITYRLGFLAFMATLVTLVIVQVLLGYGFLIFHKQGDGESPGWETGDQLLVE